MQSRAKQWRSVSSRTKAAGGTCKQTRCMYSELGAGTAAGSRIHCGFWMGMILLIVQLLYAWGAECCPHQSHPHLLWPSKLSRGSTLAHWKQYLANASPHWMTGACKFVGSGMLIQSGGTQSGSLMTGGLQRPGRQDNCKAVALVRPAHTKGWWSLIQRPLTMLAAVLHLNYGVYLHMGAADPLFQSVQLLLRQVSTAAWHLWQLQEQNISRNERMLSLKAAGL